jgi:WD40 repeat protein
LAIGLAGTRDIVAASSYRGVRVLDGITGQQVAELDTRAQTLAIGRAADRDVIVSASFSTVQVWDAVTGALTDTFHGHEGRVYAVAIGRTGEDDLIASCSENGRIFVRSFRAGTSG